MGLKDYDHFLKQGKTILRMIKFLIEKNLRVSPMLEVNIKHSALYTKGYWMIFVNTN